MTKKSISRLLQASLMCCLAVLFTACEEFGMESNPTPSYLSLNTDDVTLKVGDTYVRKAIVACTAVVIYSSSNEAVATVDQAGKVTAVGEGTATITAQATGYDAAGKKIYQPASVSYQVTITPATVPATSLTLNKTMEVLAKNGDALTITATVTPSEATFTWESSDANVATVNNGVVTPKGLGITTITAKSGDLTATCEVFVGTEVNVSSGNPIQDYDILAGTQNTSAITIPAGCHVAFNGVNTDQGITCSGDATIYLIDGKTNTVSAAANKAGIQIGGTGTTLTINAETAGTGILNATGGYRAAGIGTGNGTDSNVTGGDITINGGTVTAIGKDNAAGIGTGHSHGLYNLSVSQTCGDITIATGVTSVTAQRYGTGSSTNMIGKGTASGGGTQTCGKIKFGTAEVFNGSAWSPATMTAGTYGGLNLAIFPNNWKLTPVAP